MSQKSDQYSKIEKAGEVMTITQDSVREMLIEKSKGIKLKFIAEEIGIPREIISKFKNSKRTLRYESLLKLHDYLKNH